ncbi:unnamed protein product [Amoebophrya sp. A120]|nr:unnamed protein product [Amoebophrya sp. A120]|eukprot:GSA120T00022181001.1
MTKAKMKSNIFAACGLWLASSSDNLLLTTSTIFVGATRLETTEEKFLKRRDEGEAEAAGGSLPGEASDQHEQQTNVQHDHGKHPAGQGEDISATNFDPALHPAEPLNNQVQDPADEPVGLAVAALQEGQGEEEAARMDDKFLKRRENKNDQGSGPGSMLEKSEVHPLQAAVDAQGDIATFDAAAEPDPLDDAEDGSDEPFAFDGPYDGFDDPFPEEEDDVTDHQGNPVAFLEAEDDELPDHVEQEASSDADTVVPSESCRCWAAGGWKSFGFQTRRNPSAVAPGTWKLGKGVFTRANWSPSLRRIPAAKTVVLMPFSPISETRYQVYDLAKKGGWLKKEDSIATPRATDTGDARADATLPAHARIECVGKNSKVKANIKMPIQNAQTGNTEEMIVAKDEEFTQIKYRSPTNPQNCWNGFVLSSSLIPFNEAERLVKVNEKMEGLEMYRSELVKTLRQHHGPHGHAAHTILAEKGVTEDVESLTETPSGMHYALHRTAGGVEQGRNVVWLPMYNMNRTNLHDKQGPRVGTGSPRWGLVPSSSSASGGRVFGIGPDSVRPSPHTRRARSGLVRESLVGEGCSPHTSRRARSGLVLATLVGQGRSPVATHLSRSPVTVTYQGHPSRSPVKVTCRRRYALPEPGSQAM